RGCVCYGEGDIEDLCQRLGEKCLAGTGGADEQDVGLLKLDIGDGRVDALEMVVYRNGENPLGVFLADYVLAKDSVNLFGLGNSADVGKAIGLGCFVADDVITKLHTIQAHAAIDTDDELFDLVAGLPAKYAALFVKLLQPRQVFTSGER